MTPTIGAEYRLGPITAIPLGEGREFAVEGQQIAVFRLRSGAVYATQAACPHRNGPLVDGLLGGATVVCPLHAWKFDLTTGAALMGTCGVTTYPVRLNDAGEILLTVGERAPVEDARCQVGEGGVIF